MILKAVIAYSLLVLACLLAVALVFVLGLLIRDLLLQRKLRLAAARLHEQQNQELQGLSGKELELCFAATLSDVAVRSLRMLPEEVYRLTESNPPVPAANTREQWVEYLEHLAKRAAEPDGVLRYVFRGLLLRLANEASKEGIFILFSRPREMDSVHTKQRVITVFLRRESGIKLMFRIFPDDIPTAWPMIDEELVLGIEEIADIRQTSSETIMRVLKTELLKAEV